MPFRISLCLARETRRHQTRDGSVLIPASTSNPCVLELPEPLADLINPPDTAVLDAKVPLLVVQWRKTDRQTTHHRRRVLIHHEYACRDFLCERPCVRFSPFPLEQGQWGGGCSDIRCIL